MTSIERKKCRTSRFLPLRLLALGAMVDEKSHVAEVIHRYERDPGAVAERAAEREAAEKRREEEARRKEEAKRAAARLAHRGAATLRKERAAFERVKRLRLEMEVAVRRGTLIERELVLRQTAFLLTALRSRCMSASSAWSRRLLNISDPREMSERLRDMMTSVLEELSNLPEKVTDPDWTGDEENGSSAPLRGPLRAPAVE